MIRNKEVILSPGYRPAFFERVLTYPVMKLKIIVFLLILSMPGYGQSLPLANPPLPKGWTRVYIKNTGNIDIPPEMEIQAGKFKEFSDQQRKIRGYDTKHLVIQQKGLNNLSDNSFEKYARVMISTEVEMPGDYDKLNFRLSDYSEEDLKTLSAQLKEQFIQSFEGTEFKLVKWNGIKLEKINGMSTIHVSYIRQGQYKTDVLVNMYMFPNYDRVHRLTLSYMLKDASYWQPYFPAILKSFRISNVKN